MVYNKDIQWDNLANIFFVDHYHLVKMNQHNIGYHHIDQHIHYYYLHKDMIYNNYYR